jgi:homoserine O-acetyltransferase
MNAVTATSPDPWPARHLAALPEPFRLLNGGELQGGVIAYETWGRPNAARDNAILLFTGLSPSAHAASSAADPRPGWWDPVLGPGKAIDTDRWFVVCVNSLGSCFGSSGPASTNPATGRHYGLDFPALTVEDIASSGQAVVRSLGLTSLAAVAGASLGGMASLAFVALFPGFARNLISISGSDAASPFAIALRSVQREAIVSDPTWHAGRYALGRNPRNGMRLARKIGTITYRSAVEWQQRYGRSKSLKPQTSDFTGEFQVESYLESQAERFADSFDANCYLYLSRAMDRFDLMRHGGLDAVAAAAKLGSALIVGVETDMLFRIDEQARVAAGFERAGARTRLVRIDSPAGHDAFLADTAPFEAAIGAFLTEFR